MRGDRAKNLDATLLKRKDWANTSSYGLPNETVTTKIFYRIIKAIVFLPDGDTDYFDIVVGVLQGYILTPYLFIIYVRKSQLHSLEQAAGGIGLYVQTNKTDYMF